jgi:hypothetical protein
MDTRNCGFDDRTPPPQDARLKTACDVWKEQAEFNAARAEINADALKRICNRPMPPR